MKKIIDVTVFKDNSYSYDGWPPENILEFKEWLDKHIQAIPKEYLNTAVFDISNEDGNTFITIAYRREETDDEEQLREQQKSEKELKIEARERKILAVLKAKYEGL